MYGYLTFSEFADDDQQWLFISDGSNGGDESPSTGCVLDNLNCLNRVCTKKSL